MDTIFSFINGVFLIALKQVGATVDLALEIVVTIFGGVLAGVIITMIFPHNVAKFLTWTGVPLSLPVIFAAITFVIWFVSKIMAAFPSTVIHRAD